MTRTAAAAFTVSLVLSGLAASLALAAPQGPKGPKVGECQAPDVLVCHLDRNKEKPVCVPTAELGNHIGNHAGDYVADADGDGFTAVGACAGSTDDCRDDDPAVSPGATETCNAVDDDCDGTVDEGFDVDGDGWTTCAGDCNDGDATVSPGATETCNAVDDDCDGTVDDGFDGDGDGWTTCAGDCNDGNPAVSPGATETCNAVDDDCDGAVDESFDVDGDGVTTCAGDCDDTNPQVGPSRQENQCDGLDNDCNPATLDDPPDGDGDGFTICEGDCADDDPDRNPGMFEICTDGVDNDCDGQINGGAGGGAECPCRCFGRDEVFAALALDGSSCVSPDGAMACTADETTPYFELYCDLGDGAMYFTALVNQASGDLFCQRRSRFTPDAGLQLLTTQTQWDACVDILLEAQATDGVCAPD